MGLGGFVIRVNGSGSGAHELELEAEAIDAVVKSAVSAMT